MKLNIVTVIPHSGHLSLGNYFLLQEKDLNLLFFRFHSPILISY